MHKHKATVTFEDANYEKERNKPLPSFNHGAIQANLSTVIKFNYRKKYRVVSELSLSLSDWSSVPDLSILPWKKLNTAVDQIKVKKPPLGVVEILSPKQSFNDLYDKAKFYFEHGVKSCWIILPGVDNVYVFSTPKEYKIFKIGEILEDKKLGIKLKVAEVFE
ncbi:MAG: Uma2 family endonuclease [Bacteroidota bacterium]